MCYSIDLQLSKQTKQCHSHTANKQNDSGVSGVIKKKKEAATAVGWAEEDTA